MHLARTLVPAPREYGPRQAEVSFILFGSTKMPVREAMKWLEADGISANMLQLTTVWPFPAHEVFEFIERSKRTIVVEGNATGQLEGLIREYCLREMSHRINRFDGRPFSPEQIYTTTHLFSATLLGAAAPGAASTGRSELMPAPDDFKTPLKPTWCPGCGNFGMWEALKRALSELGWEKNEFSVVWGIGCHGNGADFLQVQGMHALHGRALPPATALKLTRPDLKVIVEMGDGDGYGLGHGALHPHDPPQPRHHRDHPRQPDLRAHDRARPPRPPTTSCVRSRPPMACSSSRSTPSVWRSPRRPHSSRAASQVTSPT